MQRQQLSHRRLRSREFGGGGGYVGPYGDFKEKRVEVDEKLHSPVGAETRPTSLIFFYVFFYATADTVVDSVYGSL